MARLMNVSASGYYAYVKRCAATVLTPRRQRRADLEVKITWAHKDSGGTYGSPRITAELRDQGEVVSAKTVAKVMSGIGIEGISPRTFKVRTTIVDPAASFPPDLVDREFDQGRLDAVWLTDITYLSCGEAEMFLCAIRDGHSRTVLGYSVAYHISAGMVTTAIEAAVAVHGGDCRGTVLHSRGGCDESRMSASGGGHGKRIRSNSNTAPMADSAGRRRSALPPVHQRDPFTRRRRQGPDRVAQPVPLAATTGTEPIIPLSSWPAMWQWNIHCPVKSVKRIRITTFPATPLTA